MVRHHAGRPAQDALRAGEQLLCPMLPSPPGRHPGLDQRPCRPGGQAAPQPERRPSGGPGLGSTLVRASHGQRRTIPFPSGPMPAGDHAAHRPRRHVDPLRPAGRPATPSYSRGQRGADSAAAAPRTPEPGPSGHPAAPDAWTPDAWTLDVRSTGWTDVPTADRTRRTGQRPAWPASGHPRDRRPPAGRPDLAGSRRLGRSASHDGSAVTTPTPRP